MPKKFSARPALNRAKIQKQFFNLLRDGRLADAENILDHDWGWQDVPRNLKRDYVPSALVDEFHIAAARCFQRGLFSCFGCGTTTAAIMDALFNTPMMVYAPRVREKGGNLVLVHCTIIRHTYKLIAQSILPIFARIVPEGVEWEWKTARSCFEVEYKKDGMHYQITMMGVGLDRPKAEEDCRGLSTDYVIVSEPIGIKDNIIEAVIGRAGRGEMENPGRVVIEGQTPSRRRILFNAFGGPVDASIEGTLEPRKFGVKDLKETGYSREHIDPESGDINKMWIYPAGDCGPTNPDDETSRSPIIRPPSNFFYKYHNDGIKYYRRMEKDSSAVRRTNLCGMHSGVAGDKIYEFDEQTHIWREKPILKDGDHIVLAADADRHAGVLFCLMRGDGGGIVFASVSSHDWTAHTFGYEVARVLNELPKGIKIDSAVIDPSGGNKTTVTDTHYAAELSRAVSGFSGHSVNFVPLHPKWNSYRTSFSQANRLLKNAAPGYGATLPTMMIYSGCGRVIDALNNYCYAKTDAIKERPDKSDKMMSALGDAFRYLCAHWAEVDPEADARWERVRQDATYGDKGRIAPEFGGPGYNPMA